MNLSNLKPKEGSIQNPKKRLGRGSSSDKGNTSTRGTKGQLARSGVSLLGFEGGQTPFYKRLPNSFKDFEISEAAFQMFLNDQKSLTTA